MTQPPIELATNTAPSSPFYFGEGIERELPSYLRRVELDRCFLVTSQPLLRLFGERLLGTLRAGGIPCEPLLIREGEAHKSWLTLSDLCERLVDRGASRDSLLLSLGGGMIGNVVGLAAGLLYRGVRHVEIPTTVMALTDGTLSNKQAINGAKGKNQFGLYHAPLFVWADCAYCRREPGHQIRAALAEGVKNSLLSGEWAVRRCEYLLQRNAALRGEHFAELLLAVIESKLAILRRDPSEKGYCIVLEYGHTFGHALEWLSGGSLFHGEAVAIGMCLAADLASELGLARPGLREKHRYLLGDLLGLRTEIPAEIAVADVYRTMLFDNKRTRDGLRFLLLADYGRLAAPEDGYTVAAEPDVVRAVLERSAAAGRRPELSRARPADAP